MYFCVWSWNTELRMFVVVDFTERDARKNLRDIVGPGGRLDIQELPFESGIYDFCEDCATPYQIIEIKM